MCVCVCVCVCICVFNMCIYFMVCTILKAIYFIDTYLSCTSTQNYTFCTHLHSYLPAVYVPACDWPYILCNSVADVKLRALQNSHKEQNMHAAVV